MAGERPLPCANAALRVPAFLHDLRKHIYAFLRDCIFGRDEDRAASWLQIKRDSRRAETARRLEFRVRTIADWQLETKSCYRQCRGAGPAQRNGKRVILDDEAPNPAAAAMPP